MSTIAMYAMTTATREQYIAGLAHVHTQYISFKVPDSTRWLVQEISSRLPGR